MRAVKRFLPLLALLWIGCEADPPTQLTAEATLQRAGADRLRGDAAALADPIYDGRRTGTNGAFAAAAWIEKEMRDAGLSNVRFQPFENTPHGGATVACKNVLGEIPGERADRLIIIGAHYDHLGSKIEDGVPMLYPGADDNASGVVGLLELARLLAPLRRPNNTIVFVAFSGEEIGLLGSSHYARTAPGRMIAMLNMDMIGRLGDGKLIVGGIATGAGFDEIVAKSNVYDVPLALKEGGLSPSDNTAFFHKDVPVLWFFTGAHLDHHKPTDTPDKLDVDGMARTVDLVAGIARAIDALPEPPEFFRVAGKSAMTAAPNGARKMVSLGTMPAYDYEDEGVLFAGVREDGAGAAGGLRAGDILIELDETEVHDVNDYTSILRDLEPNKTYTYKVLRAGRPVTGTVTPLKYFGG